MTQSIFQRVALVGFIILVAGWYSWAQYHAPAITSVNGTYSNACCGDITLRNGVVIAGKAQVPFTLENMKFGLTAFPTDRIEVSGTQVMVRPSVEVEVLAFGKSGTVLTVCGDRLCHTTYEFKRR
jgi:hypothetical protein